MPTKKRVGGLQKFGECVLTTLETSTSLLHALRWSKRTVYCIEFPVLFFIFDHPRQSMEPGIAPLTLLRLSRTELSKTLEIS